MPAAFAVLERQQQITKSRRDVLYQAFADSIRVDFHLVSLLEETLYRAARLTQQHTLKGYDAVQLGLALNAYEQLQAQNLDLIFVSSDNQLIRAAQAEGMSVENPHAYPNP